MHGLIVNQLRQYVVVSYGRAAWADALEVAGVTLRDGPPAIHHIYPDAEVVAIVRALAAAHGGGDAGIPALLEDFGAFLAPTLLRVYEPLVRPEWRTLDVIENVEEGIHTAVRARNPGAGPPRLSARRRSPTEVEIIYTSPRRMCTLGEGIVRGLAAHFGEQVAVTQPTCMHRGDDHCLIQVRLTPA